MNGRHHQPNSSSFNMAVISRRAAIAASAAAVSAALVCTGSAGATGTLPTLPTPSISLGSQPAPTDGYTQVQKGDPSLPPVIIVPGTGDPTGSQELARIRSEFPNNPLYVVNYPAAIGAGYPNALVGNLVGTGTYQQSVAAGVDGLKQAIAAQGGKPVAVVAMSQGVDVVYSAAQQGLLPAGSQVVAMGDPNAPNGLKQQIPLGIPGGSTGPMDYSTLPTNVTYNNMVIVGDGVADMNNPAADPLGFGVNEAAGYLVHGMGYNSQLLDQLAPTAQVVPVPGAPTMVMTVLTPTLNGEVESPNVLAAQLIGDNVGQQLGNPQLGDQLVQNQLVYAINHALVTIAPPQDPTKSGGPTVVGIQKSLFGPTGVPTLPSTASLYKPQPALNLPVTVVTTPNGVVVQVKTSTATSTFGLDASPAGISAGVMGTSSTVNGLVSVGLSPSGVTVIGGAGGSAGAASVSGGVGPTGGYVGGAATSGKTSVSGVASTVITPQGASTTVAGSASDGSNSVSGSAGTGVTSTGVVTGQGSATSHVGDTTTNVNGAGSASSHGGSASVNGSATNGTSSVNGSGSASADSSGVSAAAGGSAASGGAAASGNASGSVSSNGASGSANGSASGGGASAGGSVHGGF